MKARIKVSNLHPWKRDKLALNQTAITPREKALAEVKRRQKLFAK